MRTSLVIKIFFCLCFFSSANLKAADFTSKEKYPDLVVFGAGAFDFHRDCRVAQLSFEYRIGLPKFRIAQAIMGALIPFNGSLYFYGGFGVDIFLGRHLVITPSFCPGVYFQGKGKNLGYPLQFRSSVEIAYVFTSRSRIGIQGYHISNGSMAGKNPGEESLLLFYALHL